MEIRTGKRKSNHADLSKRNKPDALSYMIHGNGQSSEECRVLRDYGDKYYFRSDNAGITTAKCVEFDKMTINGKELNDMVWKFVSANLKGGGGENKPTHPSAANGNISSGDK